MNSTKMLIYRAIVLAIVLGTTVFCLTTLFSVFSFHLHPVTEAQANRLQPGIPYQQVVTILGSKGVPETIPDSVAMWKDAHGQRTQVEFSHDKVFSIRLPVIHTPVVNNPSEALEIARKEAQRSPIRIGMTRAEVEKLIGSPYYQAPIKTDSTIYRWDMKPEGNTLIVKFKSGWLYSKRIDTWTPPHSGK